MPNLRSPLLLLALLFATPSAQADGARPILSATMGKTVSLPSRQALLPNIKITKSLFGKWGQLAPNDEGCGKLDNSQVMSRFLLPAHQQATETVEPGMADLHHPATWRMALRVSRSGKRVSSTGFFGNMRDQTTLYSSCPARRGIVTAIQTQVSFFAILHWHGKYDCVQHLSEHLAVVAMGTAQHHRQGNAFAIGQERSFCARFASVSGIASGRLRRTTGPFFPSGAFTMHPSADCQVHSMPMTSPYSSRSTAQARSKQPCSTQALKRLWIVVVGPNWAGIWLHWLPVRANQIRPLKIERASRAGRPLFLRGLSMSRSGARRVQRASGTSQITGCSSILA